MAEFDPSQVGDASLVYSSYLGGSNFDGGNAIAVDSGGNAYVTGDAEGGFPTTSGAFQTTWPGTAKTSGEAFVTKIDPPAAAGSVNAGSAQSASSPLAPQEAGGGPTADGDTTPVWIPVNSALHERVFSDPTLGNAVASDEDDLFATLASAARSGLA